MFRGPEPVEGRYAPAVFRQAQDYGELIKRMLAALIFSLSLLPLPVSAQTFPSFTGFVVDAANVLPPETEADLTAKLAALQRDTRRQLVVATIPDLQGYPLEDYGNALLRNWKVGLADVNNGAIVFIAPNEPPGGRGPRIEVGYGLESILTDALSLAIINEQMMPRLKANDVPGAMTAGTDTIIAQLRASPDEAKARTDAAVTAYDKAHRSRQGGGGSGLPTLIFWGVILLFFVLPMLGRGARGRRYRGRGSGIGNVILWSAINSAMNSRSDGGSSWGGGGSDWGGGSDGGGWGGGGFGGGGGGSGGGGGASGGW